MASMKRLSKPSGLHGALEAGTIKRPGRTVIVEANRSGQSCNAGKVDMVEISLVPERGTSNLPEKVPISLHSCGVENQTTDSSINFEDATTQEAEMTLEQAGPIFLPTDVGRRVSKTEFRQRRNLKLKLSSLSTRCRKKLPVLDEIIPASVEKFIESVRQNEEPIPKNGSASSLPSSSIGIMVNQSGTVGPKLMKPLFRNKNLVEKRIIPDSSSGTSSSHQFNKGADKDLGPSTSETICQAGEFGLKKASPASSSTCVSIDGSSSSLDSSARRPGLITNSGKKTGSMITKADDSSTSREKRQFSQSSKSSSVCEYSSSTSFRQVLLLSYGILPWWRVALLPDTSGLLSLL